MLIAAVHTCCAPQGEPRLGTRFSPLPHVLTGRKRWILSVPVRWVQPHSGGVGLGAHGFLVVTGPWEWLHPAVSLHSVGPMVLRARCWGRTPVLTAST